MVMKFSEHGHYEIRSDGNIIYYRVTGIWNKEASVTCIDKLAQCFDEIVANRVDKKMPIVTIVDTCDFEGGLDEAFELWIKAAKFWYASGLSHFIRIDDPESLHYQMFLAPIDDLVRKNTELCFADNFKRALIHAHSLGFEGFENELNC